MQDMGNGTEIPSDKQDLLTDNTRDINGDNITEEIQNQKEIPARTYYGELLYFLMTTSVTRSLLLWPFLRKDGIIHVSKQTISSYNSIPTELHTDLEGAVTSDYEGSFPPIIINELEPEKKNKPNESTALVSNANNIQGCNRIFTLNGGILFQSKNALKNSLGLMAFHETAETFVNAIWGTFLSSLLINGLVNYSLYPDEREGTTVWNVLGLTSLLNIICIEKIDFFKNYLCYRQGKSYDDILASSLNLPYIWPVVLGVPILSGIVNASWRAKRQRKSVAELMDGLTRTLQRHSAWHNGYYWIFAVIIPEALSAIFPPAILLKILCITQTDINDILDQMRDAIIWNGSITASDRKKLCLKVINASSYHIGLTQLKVLSVLADIIDGISEKNLLLLEKVGLADSKNIIATQHWIKKSTFDALHKISNDKDWKAQPLNYVYANYLMWRLGYPQNYPLQILFFPYKLFKLYFTLMFYKTILGGVIGIINKYLEKKQCLEAGREWTFFEVLDEWQCTVCGDLPIFYRDIFSTEDCVRAYLERAKTFDEVMKNIANRDQQKNSWGYNRSFNLKEVTSLVLGGDINRIFILHPKELPVLLNTLKPKMLNLKMFYAHIGYNTSNLTDIKIAINSFGQFIQHSSIENLDFICTTRNEIIGNEWMKIIAEVLPRTNIKHLHLSSGGYSAWSTKIFNTSIIHTFSQGLQSSNVTYFELYAVHIGDTGMKAIATAIPHSNIIRLRLWASFGFKGCQALAENLPFSHVQSLDLQVAPDPNAVCADALIKALTNMRQDFNLSLGLEEQSGNIVVDLFAKALSKEPSLPLKRLWLRYEVYVKPEVFYAFLQALPMSKLVDFYMVFPSGLNYSLAVPQLADAMDQSMIANFDVNLKFHVLSLAEIDMLIHLLPNKLRKIQTLALWMDHASLTSNRMKEFFKVLSNTCIRRLELYGSTKNELAMLAEVLSQTIIKELIFEKSHVTINDMTSFARELNQSKIEWLFLSDNNIEDEGIKILFNGLQGSPVERIGLQTNKITDKGAKAITQALTTDKFKHDLWINTIEQKIFGHANPRTNLTRLYLDKNNITNDGARTICNILPQTNINASFSYFSLSDMGINQSIINNCGILSSSSNSLRPMGPYVLLYRLFQGSRESLYTLLYNRYKKLEIKSTQPPPEYNDTTAEPIVPIDFPKEKKGMVDVSQYAGSDTIIVDLDSHRIQNDILISSDMIAVQGSINSNNLLRGSENSLLDVSMSRRTNFLQAGKNNKLRLGFFSKDHVIVTENRGTVEIKGFDAKDTLHLISEQTVYPETNAMSCQNEMIEHDIFAAVVRLKETTVQLLNTRCEDIENNIEINNDEAIYAAQIEVMNSVEKTNSILYTSVLGICETFLNSVSKSALLTAVPKFVTEILYRVGGLSRDAAEASGREIQLTLTLSMTNAPTSVMASYLAGFLTAQLTNSPKIISGVSMGACIISSVVETLWTQDVSFGWIALQTGIALAGAGVGNMLIEKTAPITSELVFWGWNKVSQANSYAKSYFEFWKKGEISDVSTNAILIPLTTNNRITY